MTTTEAELFFGSHCMYARYKRACRVSVRAPENCLQLMESIHGDGQLPVFPGSCSQAYQYLRRCVTSAEQGSHMFLQRHEGLIELQPRL